MRRLIFVFIFFFSLDAIAQVDFTINGEEQTEFTLNNILPDRSYTIDQVATDTSLRFTDGQLYKENFPSVFWVKFTVQNSSPNFERYYLSTSSDLINQLYWYNPTTKQWVVEKLSHRNFSRYRGQVVAFPSQLTTPFYLKVDVSILDRPFFPSHTIYLKKEIAWLEGKNFFFLVWFCSLSVLMGLFLYSLYVYISLKDRTYFYYLFILIGSVFYSTGLLRYFRGFIHLDLFTTLNRPGSSSYAFYDIEFLLLSVGVTLIIWAYANFTRSFLRTAQLAPRWDSIVNYFTVSFVAFEIVLNVGTIAGFKLWFYSVDYLNIITMVSVLLNFVLSLVVRNKSKKKANYFLLANTLPLLLIGFLAVYFFINPCLGCSPNWIFVVPTIAVTIHSLALAVVLVAQVRLIQDENASHKQLLGEEKLVNEQLKQKLEYHQREIASATLHVYHKNALLKELHAQIEQLTGSTKRELRVLESSIEKNIDLDSDWDKFKLHFQEVDPAFFEQLKKSNSSLTPYEQRLCAYFHLNLSTKEIATLMNIEPASVRKAKTRLSKKISLEKASS